MTAGRSTGVGSRYAVAVSAPVAVMLLLALTPSPWRGELFVPATSIAIILVAWSTGLAPGLAATAICAAGGLVASVSQEPSTLRAGALLVAGVAVSVGFELLHRRVARLHVDHVTAQSELQRAQEERQQEARARQEAERKRGEYEQRWSLAAQAAHDGMWEWNVVTGENCWTAQSQEMLGYTADDVARADDVIALVHPDDLPRLRVMMQEHLEGKVPVFNAEMRFRRRDGSYHWVLARGIAQRDSEGRPLRVIGWHADIHQRHMAQEALERAKQQADEANQAKDRFLAVLSHELRTPLTPVMMTVQMLENDPELPEEYQEEMQLIRRNIELETRLIDDLLDLTRISRGKLQLKPEIVDAHAKLHDVLEICHPDVAQKNIALIADLSAFRFHVQADPARLQQVLWNLLRNAIKFTDAGGAITVRTDNRSDGKLLIEIIDTGRGIAPEMLPKLFNAFEQGGKDITKQFGGLGLGLAITKTLVDAHGGTLTAHSDGLGHGARFTILLPTVSAKLAARPVESAKPAAMASCRVLLVEDHPDTSRAMARLLGMSGYTVTTASTVSDAVKAASASDFDVLISDIGLPDGSGIELMRTLLQQRPLPGIALSGFGMEDDIRNAKQAGFLEHLVKPVDINQLQAVLARIVSKAIPSAVTEPAVTAPGTTQQSAS